ncbi:MAG TPA: ABC transporter permease [Gaiellaceae bacterium]|nr:ABC transporter permease [Gaiellaceae bacterium]
MSGVRRFRAWVANPWGKPRFLVLFTLLYMAWAIVPILIAVRFSFNDGRSRSTAQGWSTRWYWDDPELSVWNDPSLRESLFQSLRLASLAMLIAVPLGIALALALTRWRGRGSGSARFLSLFPLVTPEIVMGSALFLTFVHLLRFVELGTTAQAIGHVTFSISFVVIVMRSRLLSIGREYEEAAMDLGAAPRQALRMVVLPLLTPAIVASFMVVFAISIDDFVISAFLSLDASTETVPIKIYSNARGAPTPALNALASVMLFATLLAVGLTALVLRAVRRRRGERGGAIEDFAQLRV